jgi:hypothetical protein
MSKTGKAKEFDAMVESLNTLDPNSEYAKRIRAYRDARDAARQEHERTLKPIADKAGVSINELEVLSRAYEKRPHAFNNAKSINDILSLLDPGWDDE